LSDNNYYNEYMKKRYAERRKFAISFLGGKCSSCGCNENLEFDHIDRKTKSFVIADGLLWAKERLINELKKCQLLCQTCHQAKTLIDLDQTDGRNTHGTLTSYQYCKCELCKKAQSDYMKKYMKKATIELLQIKLFRVHHLKLLQ